MDRTIRYQLLPDEDVSPAESISVSETVISIYPEEQQPAAFPEGVEGSKEENGTKIPEPPSYSVATSLPSYEEAEQTKQTEDELRQQEEQNDQTQSSASQRIGDIYLGTDGIFLCSFLVAFLFNCVGLFAILCVSQTIAARFGAVSGFGLSIVKYVAFMKYQNWVVTLNDGFSWLWWFMLFLGLLMFFRGCMQYIRIKHQWARLNQQMRGRIYLYF